MSKQKIKIFVVGSRASGKTTLLQKLKKQQALPATEVTIGVTVFTKAFVIDKKIHQVELWDTQGFDSNPGILKIPQYMKCKGFMVMFDLTEQNSFQNAIKCCDEVFNDCQVENQHVLLIGNKKDLKQQRRVSRDQIDQYTEKREIDYREISLKDYTSDQINKLLTGRIKLLVAKIVANNLSNFSQQQQNKSLLQLKQQKPAANGGGGGKSGGKCC